MADVTQTKHVVDAAAYAAWARELASSSSDDAEVVDLLRSMHPRSPGRSRLDELLWAVDAGLRRRSPAVARQP